jgi:hypothetical protein
MRRLAVLVSCLVLSACTVFDGGVGRDVQDWKIDGWGAAYADFGWPTNHVFLTGDLVGPQNPGSIASFQLWRLFYVEFGLIGISLGLGPLQIGAGTLFHRPEAPASMDNPFDSWNRQPVASTGG